MSILRVFPRKTRATPTDPLAVVGDPSFPELLPAVNEVHVSVTFTWDLAEAYRLADAWERYYPGRVSVGGPAAGSGASEFEPGRYLKPGYVITTRGCPNRCSYCFVPQREGPLVELPIRIGYDVLDNNLLAASRSHIERVLDMVSRQRERARFTGGFEAARVEPWFARALAEIRTEIGFTAYDRPGDRKHLTAAAKLLLPCFTSRRLGCYVLCGYEGDSLNAAGQRCQFVADLGMVPFPMYFRDGDWNGRLPSDWQAWIRTHARGVPARKPILRKEPLWSVNGTK